MNRKSLLTLATIIIVVTALFLSSCSVDVQQSESNEIQQEPQVTQNTQTQTQEVQETVNDSAIVEEIDDLLLDENEDIEIGEII